MTRFEKWLDLLKFSDRYKSVEDLPEEMAKEEGIAEALETMLYSNDNQEYREAMTSYEMAERDRASDLEATAKKNLEKGRGIGKAEGREEGIEIGIEKGEDKKARAIAKNLLSINLAIEDIMTATGLTKAQIQNL
jgi:predicted transposase YdaD